MKQKHWWSLTSSWPDEVQRMVFDPPYILNLLYKPQTVFMSLGMLYDSLHYFIILILSTGYSSSLS